MSRYFSLGRDGEAQWERLRRSYELVRRRAVVIATSPDRKVLSECRRRLADLSPKLLRAVPDQRVVETIHDLAAQHLEEKDLPVVWLEAEGDRLSTDELNEAWRHALSSLNVARERLADRGPVFLVLAGPPELLDLVGRRSPDLWSVANPVVHLGETLEDLVEGERDDPSHLQRAEEALERGEPPELVAALRRWMVRPTPEEKLALFRDPESRPT